MGAEGKRLKMADLGSVPLPVWSVGKLIKLPVDWCFVWYGQYEGPYHTKEPPYSFPFSLVLREFTSTSSYLFELDYSDVAWRYMSESEKQYWVYGVLPRVKELVSLVNRVP